MSKHMSNLPQGMVDAAGIREGLAGVVEHGPMEKAAVLIGEWQMWHLECCVQALIEEIRGQKAKDYLKKMQAFEDYARGHSDPPKAAEMLQPSPCVQGNGPPCPKCGVAWGCWCEHRTGFPVPKAVPGDGFPDPDEVGPHCDNCAKPIQVAFGSTADLNMPQGHLRIVVCNHCMHAHANWIKKESSRG